MNTQQREPSTSTRVLPHLALKGAPAGQAPAPTAGTLENSSYERGDPHAPAAVDDLLAASRAVATQWLLGYGDSTRRAYLVDITDFFAFAAQLGTPPLAMSRGQLDLYARQLTAVRGLADSSVRRRLAAVSSFFRWALDEQVVPRSPMVRIKRPRRTIEPPAVVLDLQDARALLTAAAADSTRAEVLLMLLLLNGLRISEVLGLNTTDLGVDRGHRVARIRRKGNKVVRVPLAPPTAAALDRHLRGRTAGPVLQSRTGRRLDRSAAARLLRRLATQCLPPEKAAVMHPHACRHLAITAALDLGAPLRDVQDFANHSSSDQTRMYDQRRGALDRNPTYQLASRLLPLEDTDDVVAQPHGQPT